MGREIKLVPLDFAFPIGESFAHAEFLRHCESCPIGEAYRAGEHDECDYDWRDAVPKGDGWQLWQTVSDGPISPVFASPDELIDWMCLPDPDPTPGSRFSPWAQGWEREVADPFVRKQGSAPSVVTTMGGDGRMQVIGGAEWLVQQKARIQQLEEELSDAKEEREALRRYIFDMLGVYPSPGFGIRER